MSEVTKGQCTGVTGHLSIGNAQTSLDALWQNLVLVELTELRRHVRHQAV